MSGDFFAVLHPSGTAAGLLVCDVMGHGVRSALVTAMVRAMLEELRAVAGEPGRLLTALNRDLTRLLRQTGGLIFVTAAYAVVDLADGTLRYAQAGHPPPLRWDAAPQRVRAVACDDAQAGPALGLIDDFDYAECAEPFAPGDRLLLFTDGLTEARAPAGEEFGENRLAAVLGAHAAAELEPWLGAVLAAAGAFAGERFDDDVCLLAAEMTAAGT
jgi:sigma-B regulation protein RsbU (phosphoserine phosphatase)